MTKNKPLKIAIFITNLYLELSIVLFIILFGFFIHFQINRESYSDYYIEEVAQTNTTPFIYNDMKVSIKEKINLHPQNKAYPLKEITNTSLYITFIQLSISFFLYFFSIFEFEKVMQSVKSLQTFHSKNVTSFRRIGKYLLINIILTSFTYLDFVSTPSNHLHLRVNITFWNIMLILIAFILAEIFKEGNKLLEENELTV